MRASNPVPPGCVPLHEFVDGSVPLIERRLRQAYPLGIGVRDRDPPEALASYNPGILVLGQSGSKSKFCPMA